MEPAFNSISVSLTTVSLANSLTIYFPDLVVETVTVKVLLVPAKAEGVLVYSVFNEMVVLISSILRTESTFFIEPYALVPA